MPVEKHFGVYGAWTQDGRVVTVRKARGPYTGWLDLPGGRPGIGESLIDALQRELMEECGILTAEVISWHPFAFVINEASDGRPIDFHHEGRVAIVVPDGRAQSVLSVEDVASVELLDPRDRSQRVSPPLAFAIDLLRQETADDGTRSAASRSER